MFFLFMWRFIIKQRRPITLGSVIILCCINAVNALAAEYPTKTIQVINPFPPGAVTDIVARIAAPKLSTILGQQVIIVNKAGGGGAVGIKAAKDAARDVYTFLTPPPPILLIPLDLLTMITCWPRIVD